MKLHDSLLALVALMAILASACSSGEADKASPTQTPAPTSEPTTAPAGPTPNPTPTPHPLSEVADSELVAAAVAHLDSDVSAATTPFGTTAYDVLESTVDRDTVTMTICAWDGETVHDQVVATRYQLAVDEEGTITSRHLGSRIDPQSCLNSALLAQAFDVVQRFDDFANDYKSEPTTFANNPLARELMTEAFLVAEQDKVDGWIADEFYYEPSHAEGPIAATAIEEVLWRRVTVGENDVLELVVCRPMNPLFGEYRDGVLVDDRSSGDPGPHDIDAFELIVNPTTGEFQVASRNSLVWSDCIGNGDWVSAANDWRRRSVELTEVQPGEVAPAASPSEALPVFTRVETPPGAFSERQLGVWGAAAPQDGFGWLAAGEELAAGSGKSLPLAWSIDAEDVFVGEHLPLPTLATSGRARHAAVIAGQQLLGGTVLAGGVSHAALWQRSDPDQGWVLREDTISELIEPEAATSTVMRLDGNSTWGMLLVGVNDLVAEVDLHGEPLHTLRLMTTTDGDTLQPVVLPGVEPDQWLLDFRITDAHGFIVATSRDKQGRASRFFTSSDAGETWTEDDVLVPPETELIVHDALWHDGSWLVAGSTSIGDEQIAVTVARGPSGDWSAREIAVTFDESPPGGGYALTAIERRQDDFVGAIATNPGYIPVTSEDGQSWLVDDRLYTSLDAADPTAAGLTDLVFEADEGRGLAARGFAPPLWFESVFARRVKGPFTQVVHNNFGFTTHNDEFILVSNTTDDPAITSVWRSLDGLSWTRSHERDGTPPLTSSHSAGDVIVNWSREARWAGGATVSGRRPEREFNFYGDDGEVDTQLTSFLFARGWEYIFPPVFGEAMSGNIAATTLGRDGRPQLVVSAFSDDLVAGGRYLPLLDAPARPAAICPTLPSLQTVIVMRAFDEDDLSPAIGVAFGILDGERNTMTAPNGFAGNRVFSSITPYDCDLVGDTVVVTAVSCRPGLRTYTEADCQPLIWTSGDGAAWSNHPQDWRLHESEVARPTQMAAYEDGIIVVGESRDGRQRDSLWLITSEQISRIPTSDVIAPDPFTIEDVAVIGNRVLVLTPNSIYAGDLDYLIERTMEQADGAATDSLSTGPLSRTLLNRAAADAPTEVPEVQPPPPAPVPVPTAAPVPTAVPTQPPAPVPTPLPTPPATECVSGFDPDTNEITLTCAVPTE